MIGPSPSGMSGFGRTDVNGARRVPLPPARITGEGSPPGLPESCRVPLIDRDCAASVLMCLLSSGEAAPGPQVGRWVDFAFPIACGLTLARHRRTGNGSQA